MSEYKLVIEPRSYKGWELVWLASHNGESDYRATKGPHMVFAPDLNELLRRCDKADEITVKFRRPLSVLRRDSYNRSLEKCKITALCGERFVYVDSKGETHEGLCSRLRLEDSDRNAEREWRADCRQNRDLLKKIAVLKGTVNKCQREIMDLERKIVPLTEADVKAAAFFKSNNGRQLRPEQKESE